MKREWTDCHVHILGGGVEALKALTKSQKDYGYTASNFLSVEGMNDAAQNALGILFKYLDPTHYAFGGLHYRFAYDFAREAERLHEIGFDGIKMIENKPTERKRLGYAQDDLRYDEMYRRAAELDIPFLIHVNDPRDFWDPKRAPQWAVQAGYAYVDGTFTPYEQILEESIHMMEKHPDLRVCFAHLLFLSDDAARLRDLMERFPNMSLDVTAGTEMYYAFSEQPEVWKQFFLDFSDRILFGTDNCNRMDDNDRQIGDIINDLEKRFLTEHVKFPLWDGEIQGIGLPEDVLDKITAGNFARFASPKPRALDLEKAAEYLRERLEDPAFRLSDTESRLIGEICGIIGE